jgi:hypothetical protein
MKNILYISQLITDEGEEVLHNQFIKVKWGITSQDLSSLVYVKIEMTIRRFNCPNASDKKISL